MVSKCKRLIFGLFALMMVFSNVLFFSSFTSSVEVYAMEDNIGGGGDGFGGNISEDDKGVGDWIKNRRGMTSEQLETASSTLTPLTNMVGYFVGGCIVIVFAGVFVMTGLDLIYIVIPPVRNLLYKGGAQQGGAMGGGMGMGMGGYGGGRFGGMGGMGGQQGSQEQPIQWISDEAVYCASLLGGGAQQGGAMGGGMGMGMGGYGMGGMGGAMGGGQQQPTVKYVLSLYFRKRVFFMILLAVCAIVLTSSALLGTGVNLAQWLLKLIDMINGYVPQ